MSYAYHCCAYLGRMQVINPDISEHYKNEPIPDSHDLRDSILWLEDINDSNVNLTITELAQQFWKLYNPSNFIPSSTDQDIENKKINYNIFTNDLYAAIETPGAFPWENMIDEEESIDSGVYYQENDHQTNKPIKCLPRPDPFMPCKDLFDWWTLRLGVWIVFPLALIGNGTVLVVLVFGRRKRRRSSKLDVPRFLVCNLAAADFFMGIYLCMLAMVDSLTLGYFRSYAIQWQNSFFCQFTGFTGVFSAELSVYTLAVITLERNYAITHAMHLNKRLSLRAAAIVMSIGWFFALLMAVLPFFGVSDYRKVAVCLPFEIDNIFSLIYVLCLIVFNGFAFLLLMACYLRMYCAIRGSQAWNSNDTRIAMRMALLVFTDFLCWAPIAFFTITALTGWHLITLEEAKIFTIFILPLNACANPFLYAFFTKQFKKECANLYKRIDALKCINGNSNRYRGQFGSNHTPVRLVKCKICGHRDQREQCLWKSNVNHRHNYKIVKHTPSLSNSCTEQKQNLDNENNNNNLLQNFNDANKCVDVVKNEEQEPKPRSEDDEECACHCHHHHHQMLSSKFRDNNVEHQSYTRQFIKQLLTNNKQYHQEKKSSVNMKQHSVKQFKSNSIIYQSNYRKNHIHMALENEICLPHYKKTNNLENLSNKKRPRTQSSSSSPAKFAAYDQDDVNVTNSSQNRNDKSEVNQNSVLVIIKERDGPNLNSITEYNRRTNDDGEIETIVQHHYTRHQSPTSAMTTGIQMLKNKLTRNNKSYGRKVCVFVF